MHGTIANAACDEEHVHVDHGKDQDVVKNAVDDIGRKQAERHQTELSIFNRELR